ncbi:glycosyltransferase [soil metagenome]
MRHGVSRAPSFAILSALPPTQSGSAYFGAALADGLESAGAEVTVVRIADGAAGADSRLIGELVTGDSGSVAAAAELLNQSDVAVIAHDHGVHGDDSGGYLVDLVEGLRVPSILIVRTVLKDPSPQQRSIVESLIAGTDHVVVLSAAAHTRLCSLYDVERRKVSTIAHGSSPRADALLKRPSRPTLVTWGLLRPGKGIERVIDAMAFLRTLPGRPKYQVTGPTHPTVLATEGEAYRDALIEQIGLNGTADAVTFDPTYRIGATLSALIRSATAVVLPYDSTDQAASSLLVEAIAHGRPVVATAFPHAVELLSSGAGIVVEHDPDALSSALHRVLTQPRLSGSMAAEARALAPAMAWRQVASTYLSLAQRLVAQRRTLV